MTSRFDWAVACCIVALAPSSASAVFCGGRGLDFEDVPCRDVNGNILGFGALAEGAVEANRLPGSSASEISTIGLFRGSGGMNLDCLVTDRSADGIEERRTIDACLQSDAVQMVGI